MAVLTGRVFSSLRSVVEGQIHNVQTTQPIRQGRARRGRFGRACPVRVAIVGRSDATKRAAQAQRAANIYFIVYSVPRLATSALCPRKGRLPVVPWQLT